MSEFYRIVGLPDRWPAGEQLEMSKRPKAPFKAGWADTIRLLEAEVRALKGRDVLLRLDVAVEDLNRQGGIRADARIRNSAVVLELTSGSTRLTFPCDAFDWWQSNVRALALALGDLRRVDRYRVNRGKQYEGFKALGSGGSAPAKKAMTPAEAAAVVHRATKQKFSEWEIFHSSERSLLACRAAKAAVHPDAKGGGSDAAFTEVAQAETVLIAHQICSWCGDPWGLYGCRSLYVIAALESAIHANTVLQKRAREAAESLADGRSFAEWRVNSAQQAWEVRAVFSTEALLVGGFGAVTHGLLRISREMRKKYDELTKPRGFEALGQALAHALADQARNERRRAREAERKP